LKPDSLSAFSIVPLQGHHRKEGFVSGIPELDAYLLTQANQDAKRNVAAPFVLLPADGQTVAGYYTLSAFGIRVADLPEAVAKKLPKYPILPAAMLGRLAVAQQWHGQKLCQCLLMDALRRSLVNTREVGSVGVVVDAYDENAQRFYRHHGFVDLPGESRRLFLSVKTIRAVFT
jgi:predicted GNAT family N-acyltransferase